MTARAWGLTTAAGVLLLDRLTKLWAQAVLPDSPITVIDGVLQLRYVTNPGAAFGLLPGAGSIIALVAVAVVIIILGVVRRVQDRAEATSLGLILGGALGNLFDRLFRGPGMLDGEVIDFIDFSFFPAFNVADMGITIGAAMIIILVLGRR